MSKHAIPLVLTLADILAALVCVYHKDYARSWYWLSAASITASTIMMKS